MAYKSRVTNQYMGATFAGQVASSNKSDVTDLVNILQKKVNPPLAQIPEKYVETKKDVAKEKINELFTCLSFFAMGLCTGSWCHY